MSHREDVLNTAAELTGSVRNKEYGEPNHQMRTTEALLTQYVLGKPGTKSVGDGTGHDTAMFMALNKISRIACGSKKRDNYVDAAAYLAMAYECIAEEPVGEDNG